MVIGGVESNSLCNTSDNKIGWPRISQPGEAFDFSPSGTVVSFSDSPDSNKSTVFSNVISLSGSVSEIPHVENNLFL